MDGDFIDINEINGFLTYLRSIDWWDPWLIALLSFHVIITLTCLTTRNYGNFQILLFFVLLLLVYFSESINDLASRNWTLFSRQQYFDSKGLFISIVFSVPILLNCMIMVEDIVVNSDQEFHLIDDKTYIRLAKGHWLYQSTQLMVNLKKAQLRQQLKRQSSTNAAYNSSSKKIE